MDAMKHDEVNLLPHGDTRKHNPRLDNYSLRHFLPNTLVPSLYAPYRVPDLPAQALPVSPPVPEAPQGEHKFHVNTIKYKFSRYCIRSL